MKKIISVFLAALLLFCSVGVITVCAADDEGFTLSHTVRVASSCEGQIEIVGVEYPDNKVPHGHNFYFTIRYINGYQPDGTVVVKCYPASYMPDLVVTPEDNTYITTLDPDQYGVYTIQNVTEDYYVVIYNMQTEQFASLKTMLLDFFNAILNLLRRIFKR